tara:strand:- start:22 stop:1146 length:1125 start_codon:yes stop_codon:yes gene_type:complete
VSNWEQFCERLRILGDGIADMPGVENSQDIANGHRHLLGLLAHALQVELEFADRDVPTIYRHNTDNAQWGAPSPDFTYWRAKIEPSGTYRIAGKVPDGRPFVIQLPQGEMHFDQYGSHGEITSDDLEISADGSFELILSDTETGGNWLPLNGASDHVSIREFFLDWNGEPGWFTIERLDRFEAPRIRPNPVQFSEKLDTALDWTEKAFTYWQEWAQTRHTSSPVNEASPPRSVPGGADNIAYGGIGFDLGPDEALVIDVEEPVAKYWSFILYDLLWYQSPMFGQRQTSLNNAQIETVDGKCRIVVAHKDPGWENWIDTTGIETGSIAYRYVWAETQPLPSVSVMPFDEIVIEGDQAKRNEQLSKRRLATQRRFR